MDEERRRILDEKAALRKEMSAKRDILHRRNKREYDRRICDELVEIIEQRKAKVIHAYLTMGSEINITPMLQKLIDEGKTIVTPKTLPKRKLQNLVLNSISEIEQGIFGTTHPANSYEYSGDYDLIIVPGMAFDKNKYRVGYGGGYYDNFLVNYPNAYKVGIFYPFQEVENVPREAHDTQLDTILTIRDVEL